MFTENVPPTRSKYITHHTQKQLYQIPMLRVLYHNGRYALIATSL
jgi:hypothetical protein